MDGLQPLLVTPREADRLRRQMGRRFIGFNGLTVTATDDAVSISAQSGRPRSGSGGDAIDMAFFLARITEWRRWPPAVANKRWRYSFEEVYLDASGGDLTVTLLPNGRTGDVADASGWAVNMIETTNGSTGVMGNSWGQFGTTGTYDIRPVGGGSGVGTGAVQREVIVQMFLLPAFAGGVETEQPAFWYENAVDGSC